MATKLDNCCPICLGSWEEASYVTPCLHQFCYPCILRWAESKPECPLCKRRILSIMHSVQAGDDFEEHVITPFVASSVVCRQAGGAPGRPAAHSLCRLAATQPQPVGLAPRAPLGGLQPNTWASLFWDHPALLQPLLTWVRQLLGQIFGNRHLRTATAEGLVLSLLVLFGLEEDLLVQLLRASLQNHTSTFVHQLIGIAVQRCSGEAHRLLGLEDGHAARGQEGCPVAAPGPAAFRGGSPMPGPAPSVSPEGTNEDNLPSTSAAALRGGPGSPPSAPVSIPWEQEEPQEEPEEAMAHASASHRGRERSPGEPRRPPKRRAGSPEASSPTKKRLPHQRQQNDTTSAAETRAHASFQGLLSL
ncbi:E3 ubiquitin-protein ligase Topors-like [Grus japonensis]|uniref:E3 ubiquitin-protein ligase Topors n=1 Tax=Grus japonensis TaxID=30415 RepID=A0ABC9Y2Z4_GRUJA